MTITWGAWKSSGGNKVRFGVEVASIVPPVPATAHSQVDVTTCWYAQWETIASSTQGWSIAFSGGVVSGADSGTLTGVVTGQVRLLTQRTDPVDLVYGSTQAKTLAGSATLGPVTAVGVSLGITIPARPFQVPAAPTSVTATRVNDTQVNVAWTRNHSAPEAPYQSQVVEFQSDSNTTTWTAIATLAGTATSYSHTSLTAAPSRHRYRVRAVNSAGSTASAATAYAYMTPYAPTGLTTVRDAAGNIVIAWTPQVNYSEHTHRVEHSEDGGAYTQIASVAAGTNTYTHTSPDPAKTHRYRVRAASTVGTVLYSDYTTGPLMSLAAPPNAPSLLKPNGVATMFDHAEEIWFSWRHNPTDFSPQSKWEIRYRKVGAGSWESEENNTDDSALEVSGWFFFYYNSGDVIEWQVRTWGAHADPSPWSALATTTLSAKPQVTVEHPNGADVFTTLTIAAEWTYYHENGSPQAEWRAYLFDNATGALLETRTGLGDALDVTFDHDAVDGVVYHIQVQARSALGVWSNLSEGWGLTELAPPEAFDIAAVWDAERGHIVLSLTPLGAVEDESEAAVSVDVERSTDGGPWVVVATGLDPEAALADTTPATLGVHEYRVVATTESGGAGVAGTTTIEPGEDMWGYLSVGPGFGTVARFFGNIKVTDAGDVASVSHHFARGGDGVSFPVALMSKNASQAIGVAATIDSVSSTPAEFMAIAHTPSTALLRLPDGSRVFGTVKGLGRTQELAQFAEVSFTVERTQTPAGY